MKNAAFVCGWDHDSVRLREVSSYGRIKMQCFYVAGALTECSGEVSAHGRRPVAEVQHFG